jgi:hypothetical protein
MQLKRLPGTRVSVAVQVTTPDDISVAEGFLAEDVNA